MPGWPISRCSWLRCWKPFPVVGSVVPGSTIILALSALVPGGELRLEWVLAAAVAGALLGDGSAFWVGHRTPTRNPQRLADGELSERGGAERGVLQSLGRAGGVLCPLRAADSRLRADHGGRARHAAAALLRRQIPAILLWAPAHVLPGVLAVSALHDTAVAAASAALAKHLVDAAVHRRRVDRRRWRSGRSAAVTAAA